MCFTVCVAELPEGGMGVDLRCGESLMSEELPHAFDVGAVVQQGCGIAVTQHVRRALLERNSSEDGSKEKPLARMQAQEALAAQR